MKRVALVGGGPGALFAAFLLGQKSSDELDVTLFEARKRLGGKVQTARFDAAPILYEAGVAELYRYGDDPLWLLITEHLGLPVVEMGGNIVVFEGKVLEGDADIERHFGQETARAIIDFRRRARASRTFPQFYNGGWPADNRHPWAGKTLRDLLSSVHDPVARRYIEVLIHSDVATEPRVTSGLYGIDNYLINESDYCQLYSIEGGIERVISALAGRISAKIRLNTRVSGVEKTDEETYRVVLEQGGQRSDEEFDAVVMALPTYWLKQISFGGTELRRAVDRHVARYDDPAHYLRITALFREPFWQDTIHGSYFIHDAFGGCCVYDEGTRYPTGRYGVLSWLLGGSDALALSVLPDEEIVLRAIDSLPAEIASAASAREQLVEGHVHRFTGMVNGRPGGPRLTGSRKRHRPEPDEHPGLLFVGDYLFDATTNGAFDSADIVTSMLLEHLRVAPRTPSIEHFDDYCGSERTYEESFDLAFDARYVTEMLKAVWGVSPPYRLLDAGSASGVTLAAFEALGVHAWGIENGWYIHAKTPPGWRDRNVFGDVWKMPFPDGHFDFVHETCLSYVPEVYLDAALAELHRVTKRGLMFGSVAFGSMAAGSPPALFEKRGPLRGVQTSLTPEEWTERLIRSGFEPAITDREIDAAVRRVEKTAPRGRPVRPSGGMKHAFWNKVSAPGP